MKKHVKSFILKGLTAGGFGPVFAGIIYFFIWLSTNDVSLNGLDILILTASTYLLAFVSAGTSSFYEIEKWSLLKTVSLQCILLYVVYVFAYIVNGWIKIDWMHLLIFTGIFIVGFIIIWVIIYFIIQASIKRLNRKFEEKMNDNISDNN